MSAALRAVVHRWLPTTQRRALADRWATWWLRAAARGFLPRSATRVAAWPTGPYYGRHRLAGLHPGGYTAPTAVVHHPNLHRGRHTFVGDRVLIYADVDGGPVSLGDGAVVNQDVCVQTGQRGTVAIGAGTHIQPRCQLSAYVGAIRIGDDVQIAPSCMFYPYDHGLDPAQPISRQPLVSTGDVTVGDGAWIGANAILLSGAQVGAGAVVAAGAVVVGEVPAGAIAAGVPARVVGTRAQRAVA